MSIAESSKGRTPAFEAEDLGSTPSSATNRRNYHAEWYERNKTKRSAQVQARKKVMRKAAREYLQEYLQSHPCVDCGETDAIILEFDHVRGTKKNCVPVLAGLGYTIKSIQEEIDKCEVRCPNCHRRRHALAAMPRFDS